MKKFIVMILVLLLLPMAFAGSYSESAWIEQTLLNQDPDPAIPGDYVEVRWKIEKFGNDEIKDIDFELIPEYPFSFDESDYSMKTLGDWIGRSDDKEYYVLYYKLRVDENALEGNYDIVLRYKIGSKSNSWVDQEYTIRVDEKKNPDISIGSITTDPVKLLADSEENQIMVEILNTGDETAEAVFVDLDLPEGFSNTYSYSTRTNIGNIPADSSKTATFYIDVDDSIFEGEYDTILNLKYKSPSDDQEITYDNDLPIQLEVKDKPTFELLGYHFDPQNITPGSEVKLIVDIKNIGSRKVESVSLRAYKDSSQPFDMNEKSDYIGTLWSDEIGQAILSFDVDEDANPKNYQLDLEIRSVKDGQVFITDKTLTIDVKPNEKDASKYTSLIIPIVIGIVLFAVGFIYGRTSKKKKKSKK